MAFNEIDRAQAEAANTRLSEKRGKKRLNATVTRLNPLLNAREGTNDELGKLNAAESNELRTGRWTTEETEYCDQLIELFEAGLIPIPDGIKLNDFLSNMLKSKQSRLTKKMKNARLSSRQYQRTLGYIVEDERAREFSQLESKFFASIRCNMERSEIRFHMQKEWRELFSSFCLGIGQKLDADAWLTSVEEMDRRESHEKDAARLARRKRMMGQALHRDTMDPQNGVFIDADSSLSDTDSLAGSHRNKRHCSGFNKSSAKYNTSPFVERVAVYMQRHNVPFEHVDVWAPSFSQPITGEPIVNQTSRLCFAGAATTDVKIPLQGGLQVALTSEEQYDLVSFGEYSQKFSFDVGCGLPGRVYSSGASSWEQGIQNAPSTAFERIGGASQWGIQTVLCIPVPSPNVGRLIVVFYSLYDRVQDQDMVVRIIDELSALMPSPRWKLTVDIGSLRRKMPSDQTAISEEDACIDELLALIRVHTPADKSSPMALYLPGFTALRMLLTKSSLLERDDILLKAILRTYKKRKHSGQAGVDIAWTIARDFMVMSKQQMMVSNSSESNTTNTALVHCGCTTNGVSDYSPSSGCCPPNSIHIDSNIRFTSFPPKVAGCCTPGNEFDSQNSSRGYTPPTSRYSRASQPNFFPSQQPSITNGVPNTKDLKTTSNVMISLQLPALAQSLPQAASHETSTVPVGLNSNTLSTEQLSACLDSASGMIFQRI
jgi:hypothetical protein